MLQAVCGRVDTDHQLPGQGDLPERFDGRCGLINGGRVGRGAGFLGGGLPGRGQPCGLGRGGVLARPPG
eukprot:12196908-Heterocapsa_arctica.AAC.1